ncbi:sensor domain-containing protein [Virgibacillus flavescens]|uniref:sensor domain-containing protein n=1 Tax=Virgibacillus flavescens TaxID=1611422 RepID=UPI003D326947
MVIIVGVGIVILNIFAFVLFKSHTEKKIQKQLVDLKMNEQFYQSLYQQNPDMVLTFDTEGKFLSANKIVESYGYTEEELLHRSFAPHVVPDQLEKTLENFYTATKGTSTNHETAIYSESGEQFNLNITNIPIIVNNQVVGVYAILKDITEHKNAQKALAEAEEKYRNLTENSLVGTYITQDGKFIYANPKLLEMLGYSEDEIIGSNVIDCIYPEDRPMVYENIKKRLLDSSVNVDYQYRMVKKDNTLLYVQNYGSTMVYQGNTAAIGAVSDITEQKKAQETIEYMAYHDALTGLSNRHHFYNHLKTTLAENTTENLAILFFDLDRFKMINDSMGHGIGDRLLQAVSKRLIEYIGNQGELARNGGDEFLVSLLNMDQEKITIVANQILDCFTKPFYIDQYELYTTPSIGISSYPHDGDDVETLIKKADSAMYRAKRKGTNNYQFYFSNQIEKTYKKFEVEMDLRKALEQQEFELYYQPKVNLSTGKMVGAEALMRWNHPEKGFISPGEFIPRAEETGLIIPMGEWVLRTACLQAKKWQENGLPPFELSVNLSVRQLYQPNLVEMIRQVIWESGLDPKNLELEITESMMADSDHVLKVLRQLKELGVKISLDDFGTGFSSLHYLKDAPIDKLKIDQSFIRHCTKDMNDATIVKTIIAMAHQLKLEVIAEGVETKDQLIFLQQNLCEISEGYLFSKPLPPKEFVLQFGEIEKNVNLYGIPEGLQNRQWMEKALQIARQELLDTIRMQQGMTFKYIKEDAKFIHTLCGGGVTLQNRIDP